jgi:arylsulfatase A-like enzyme
MRRSLVLLALCSVFLGCHEEPAPAAKRPNVLWVVWDTTRADHLSAYGYSRKTTPFLEEFSKRARVFEDCQSSSCWTVPSHASMFTGLLPAEHGAMHGSEFLDENLVTVAELLRDSGYQTFAWAANPHVSAVNKFLQGFEVQKHPFDEDAKERAIEIFKRKVPESVSTRELAERAENRGTNPWVIKAAGELGAENFATWLDGRDSKKPFLAFFNYMEAHRPLIPPREVREKLLTKEEVDATYATEFPWNETWAYCFGLYEYTPERLVALRDVYDAALLELDGLFAGLVAELEKRGLAEDTVIVVTADHGENLGEHHLLDHQYALNQSLVRVPLIVRYPARFAPGHDKRPVMSMDLFPTLLELAGLPVPQQGVRHAQSLLSPKETRVRVSDYQKAYGKPIVSALKVYPDRDFSRFANGLMSCTEAGKWKLVLELGGAARLYDLESDAGELVDVAEKHPEVVERLRSGLGRLMKAVQPIGKAGEDVERSAEHQRLLDSLGYGGEGGEIELPKKPEEPKKLDDVKQTDEPNEQR